MGILSDDPSHGAAGVTQSASGIQPTKFTIEDLVGKSPEPLTQEQIDAQRNADRAAAAASTAAGESRIMIRYFLGEKVLVFENDPLFGRWRRGTVNAVISNIAGINYEVRYEGDIGQAAGPVVGLSEEEMQWMVRKSGYRRSSELVLLAKRFKPDQVKGMMDAKQLDDNGLYPEDDDEEEDSDREKDVNMQQQQQEPSPLLSGSDLVSPPAPSPLTPTKSNRTSGKTRLQSPQCSSYSRPQQQSK